MGHEYSLPDDFVSNFTTDEIKRLGKRFHKLDTDQSGTLSADEIMSLPELHGNPVVQRVIDVFDEDGNKEIDFKEFINGMSQFTMRGVKAKKLRFIFQLYDINGDGFISNGELHTVLQMLVGSNLSETQLQQIVDKTIRQFDRDGDGKISYEEFCYAAERYTQYCFAIDEPEVFKGMVVDV